MLIELLRTHPAAFAILVPALLLSLTLHEFAHARIALAMGDATALHLGRVSLNPLRHLDPLGTLMLLFAGFGWARPVPVNPYHLHPRRLGEILVSLAGPLSNLALAVLAGCLLRIVLVSPLSPETGALGSLLIDVLVTLLVVNIGLCVFNLLPLFPLDGHHILREILPAGKQAGFMHWQGKYGVPVLILLMAGPGLLSQMLRQDVPDPLDGVFSYALQLTHWLTGLSG